MHRNEIRTKLTIDVSIAAVMITAILIVSLIVNEIPLGFWETATVGETFQFLLLGLVPVVPVVLAILVARKLSFFIPGYINILSIKLGIILMAMLAFTPVYSFIIGSEKLFLASSALYFIYDFILTQVTKSGWDKRYHYSKAQNMIIVSSVWATLIIVVGLMMLIGIMSGINVHSGNDSIIVDYYSIIGSIWIFFVTAATMIRYNMFKIVGSSVKVQFHQMWSITIPAILFSTLTAVTIVFGVVSLLSITSIIAFVTLSIFGARNFKKIILG